MPKQDKTATAADLIYVGNGSYLLNVPARDLTGDELEQLGLVVSDLLRSKIYVAGDSASGVPVPDDNGGS